MHFCHMKLLIGCVAPIQSIYFFVIILVEGSFSEMLVVSIRNC